MQQVFQGFNLLLLLQCAQAFKLVRDGVVTDSRTQSHDSETEDTVQSITFTGRLLRVDSPKTGTQILQGEDGDRVRSGRAGTLAGSLKIRRINPVWGKRQKQLSLNRQRSATLEIPYTRKKRGDARNTEETKTN